MSGKGHEVVVYLKKTLTSSNRFRARFGKCILNFFGHADEGFGFVGVVQEEDKLIIHGLDTADDKGILLKHPVLCPTNHLSRDQYNAIPQNLKERGVGVAVSILVTSNDDHVLVTRRASHMRTFPGVWVPPGGHVEPNEALVDAGLRELYEETGLHITEIETHHLGLWESVYPHSLEYGDPVRQHIVAYIAIKISQSWKRLAKEMKLDPKEVDAAMWMPAPMVERISTGKVTLGEIPDMVTVLTVSPDGNHEEIRIESAPIIEMKAPKEDATSFQVERVTWGTRFALQEWTKWIKESYDNPYNENSSKL